MSNKPQISKVETFGVGGFSSLALLVINKIYADSEWLTVIQALIPFVISIFVYIFLYAMARAGIDNLEVYTTRQTLERNKKNIKTQLDEAKERGARKAHINALEEKLDNCELALAELDSPSTKISKSES